MTAVGSVELAVIPTGIGFAAELTKIANEGAGIAARESAKTFGLEFSKALKGSGAGGVAAMFTGVDVEAAKAGIASGKSYASGFTEAVRVNGMSATILGTDAKGVASAEAAGVTSGRAYSRGMATGQAEGSFAQGLTQSLRGAEAAAAGSGDRAARSFVTSFTGGLGKIGTGVALAFAVVGVESIKMATEFDKQMELLHTQAGATQAEVNSLKGSVLNLAGAVGQGPNQLAEALFHIESDGYRGAAALDILKISAEGAATGNAKLDDTTYALVSTMKALSDTGLQGATKDMGTLNAIVGAGDIRMQQLNGALSTGILGTMKTFGISLTSTGAALDYLTQRGEPATQSATRLAMGITLLAAPTKQAAKYLGDLGLTTQTTADQQSAVQQALEKSGLTTTKFADDLRKPDGLAVAIQDLNDHLQKSGVNADTAAALISRAFGGGRTGKAIMQMAVDVGGISDAFNQIDKTQGQFGADFAATQQTLSYKWHAFIADLQVDSVKLGHFLEPFAKGAITGITDVGRAFGDTYHFLHDHLVVLGAIVAAYAALNFERIIGRFSDLILILEPLRLKLLAVGDALTTLGGGSLLAGAVGATGIGAAAVGLVAELDGIVTGGAKADAALDKIRSKISSPVDTHGIQQALTDTQNAIDSSVRHNNSGVGLITGVFSGADVKDSDIISQGSAQRAALQSQLDNVKLAFTQLHNQFGISQADFDKLAKQANISFGNGTGNTWKALNDGVAAFQRFYEKTTTGAGAIIYFNNKVDDLDAKLKLANNDSVTFIGTVQTWNDKAASNATALANAQTGLASANSDLLTKQGDYNTALGQFGASSPQAVSAYADLQNAVKSVSDAQTTLNNAQPPTVDSVLKKLGLDDATLKKATAATGTLIKEGISGNALSSLLQLDDPQVISTFAAGGQGAVNQLNAAVAKFTSDTNATGSFAQLSTTFKKGGADAVSGFISTLKTRAADVQTADDAVFTTAAKNTLGDIVTLARNAGLEMPGAAGGGIKGKEIFFLQQLSATFTKPQQQAVAALEALATTGGVAMATNLANAIQTHTPLVITKQQALKDGINAETQKILQQIGITINVTDNASAKILSVKKIADNFVNSFKSSPGTVGPAFASIMGFTGVTSAQGNLFEAHDAQIAKAGAMRLWAEPETGGEAYIPLAPGKRDRSIGIWAETGRHLGVFADGGINRPTGAIRETLNLDKTLDNLAAAMNLLAGAAGGGSVVSSAAKYLGSPYLLGGDPYTSPLMTDCSGLVDRAFADIGHRLPGRPLTWDLDTMGTKVPNMAAAAPGDLLMMNYGEGGIPGPGHVGIYVSPGQMIHDPKPGGHVEYINIWETPGDIRRLLGTNSGNVGLGPVSPPTGTVQQIAQQMLIDNGWGGQWGAFDSLENREASWNVFARNSDSGAYGLPQALPAEKMASAGSDWQSNPATQLRWMMGYIKDRYGDPNGAWAHEVSAGWYDNGGILAPGLTIAANGTGANEAILTGSQFDSMAKLANGGIVTGAALTDLHQQAAAANAEIAAYLKGLAAASNKAEAAYLKTLAQIAKLGVTGTEKLATGDIATGQKAIAQAVKEGNGPLQAALTGRLRTAEGNLYATDISAVRDGAVSPAEYAAVQARAKAVTDLTAQLVKLNTVNTSLLDGLKTFAGAQQQFRDSLNTSVATGAGFTDLLKLSGSPSDLQSTITGQLAALTTFTTKIKQLKAKGYSDVIIRDVAQDGIQNGTLYADLLLSATGAQAASITSAYGSLFGAQLGSANSITALTEGKIPGITQTGAATNYVNTAIFTTTGGNVDLLLQKAEFAARTGVKTFDSGGYLYPGRTVADNLTGGREKVLNSQQTAEWESGMSGGGRVHIGKVEHHYNGVDLATAHAQSNRDLALALTAARVGG